MPMQEHLEDFLGERIWRHTIVLFTWGDRLGDNTIEQHIQRRGEDLQQLVEKCGNRYHVLSNWDRGNGTQVSELLEKIEEMVADNCGWHFTTERNWEMEEKIRQRAKERERQREREIREKQEMKRERDRLKKEFKAREKETADLKQRNAEGERKIADLTQRLRAIESEMEQIRKEMDKEREDMTEREERENKRDKEKLKQRDEERGREEELKEKVRKTLKEEELKKEIEESTLPVKRSQEIFPPDMRGGAAPERSPGETPSTDTSAPPSPSELRLVLLGRTGAGKSAAGNTILGREEFPSEASSSAVTQESAKGRGRVTGRWVAVVDTPDWFHTPCSQRGMRQDVGLCINLSSPGPHAFLLVIPLGRSTGEEKRTLERVWEMFGEGAVGHTMLLFTHADQLEGKGIQEFLETGSVDLQWLVEKCGNRYHSLNNKTRGDGTQVAQLLAKIQEVVVGNNGSYYSNQMYQETEFRIRQRQEEILREREERKQREEEGLREKQQKEVNNCLCRIEEEIQQREEKIRVLEGQIAELEERLRKERDEEIRRALEEELRRERELSKGLERERERLREERERQKREIKERHRREMEDLRQCYEEQARDEAERGREALEKIRESTAQSTAAGQEHRVTDELRQQYEEKVREVERYREEVERLNLMVERLSVTVERLSVMVVQFPAAGRGHRS